MNVRILIVLLVMCTAFSFAQKRYYKGNTHTHSYPRSGDAAKTWTADKAVETYKAAGYGFLVFTEHGEYWDADSLSTPDFTVISGEEAGISGGGRWGHFTAMRIRTKIVGRNKTHQELLDEIASQGGLGFLNHPRWSVIPITASQVIDSMKRHLRVVEVYNGNTDKPTRFDTSLWDSVLTSGRIMVGVASDDTHKESHFGKGWICVYASSNHPDTLLTAIGNGEFYASNGIVIDTIGISPERIHVRSTNGTKITFIGNLGRTLETVEGPEASYIIKGDEGYVRCQVSNGADQTAWIQPVVISPAKPMGL